MSEGRSYTFKVYQTETNFLNVIIPIEQAFKNGRLVNNPLYITAAFRDSVTGPQPSERRIIRLFKVPVEDMIQSSRNDDNNNNINSSGNHVSRILSSLGIPAEDIGDMIYPTVYFARKVIHEERAFGYNSQITVAVMAERPMAYNMEIVDDTFRPSLPYSGSSIEDTLEKLIITTDGSEYLCVICLEKLPIGVAISRMPCSHVYHRDCIIQWLRRSPLCPLCRFRVPTTELIYTTLIANNFLRQL